MFFPFGTDRPLRRPTLVNHVLMGLCVAMYLVQVIVRQSEGVSSQGSSSLEQTLQLKPWALTAWGFVTYQFLHGDLLHLLGNMLFLWVFGPNVEDRLGRIGYPFFYLVGGAFAGLLHALFSGAGFFKGPPVIGASGAISAVTGAYLVLFPRTHIKTFVFFFFIGVFQIPAMWFIGFSIFRDLFGQAFGGERIAYLAHIGGYMYGAGVCFLLLWTKLLEREAFDLFSIGRQAKRRRQFKEITSKGADPWSGQGLGAKKSKRDIEQEEALARRRADISAAVAAGDVAEAARAYVELIDEREGQALHRDAQVAIANHLYEHGGFGDAARAFELFLKRHAHDREAPHTSLMLGLIYARRLHMPEAARPHLARAAEDLPAGDEKTLAQTLLDDTQGAAPTDAG